MHQSQLQNSPITPVQEGFSCSQTHSDAPTEALPPVPFHQCLLSPCCLLLILAIFVCFVTLIVYLVECIVSLCLYLCFFWVEPESTGDECDEYDESNDDSYSELSELCDCPDCFGYSDEEYDDSYSDSEAGYSEDECSIDSGSENDHSETEMESYEDFIEDKMSIDTSNSNASVSENVSEDTPITCSYCCEPLKEDEEPIQPCDCKMNGCHECIRTFFRLAIHDEMSMPPRCCRPIPLAIGRMVLSPQEIDLYKEKHDEWSTADRCYCPLPTCSAFLPPRLFPELSASQRPHTDVLEEEDLNMEPDPWNTGPPPRPIINCPKCTVAICVKCVQIVHAKRDCSRDDGMTPELTNELERIGYKRCPKCRAAVRKTYGCRHMRCRCGAQWCWYCYLSVLDCENNGCMGEESEGSDGEGYLSDEEVGDAGDGGLEDIMEHDDEELSASDEGYDDHLGSTEWTGGRTWNSTEYLSDEDDYDEDDDVPMARDIDDFNAEWKTDGAAETEPEPEPEAEFESELEEAASEAEVEDDPPNQEPEMGSVVPFDCTHKWRPLEDFEVDTSLEYECEHCWRHIYPSMTPISELQSSIDADDEIQPSMTVFDLLNDNIMLQCSTCCMILCNSCCRLKF